MKNKFYITTSIAYTNAEPHIGYAMELIQADVLARYHRLKGEETWFLTGTDEHGIKIARAAAAANKDTKAFVDELAAKFEALPAALNVANDDFIRTSDQTRHWPTAIKLWEVLQAKGDLYKKNYEGLYCVGHEAFIKKSELVDGLCPIHKTKPEVVAEENWFFKLSKYTGEIKKRIENDELKILPVTRKKEILNLLDDAEDVSVSRPSKQLSWGIPVPNDPSQTMYVWVDALSNYISALGWDHDGGDFKKFWPADVHLIGKDILRFHAIIWPAILLSAEIELPKAIYVHGFVTANGEKMSKSIGNVVDPVAMVEKYGTDVVRYFLLREIPSDEDGDFSEEKLIARYNGDLANGLGNLVQRVVTLISNNLDGEILFDSNDIREEDKKFLDLRDYFDLDKIDNYINNFQLHKVLEYIWFNLAFIDYYINEKQPWAEVKNNKEEFKKTMLMLVRMIYRISSLLWPFMPETADKISEIFDFKKESAGLEGRRLKVRKSGVLFPRL